MATDGLKETHTFKAGADLSAAANQFKIVKIDTAAADQVILAAASTTVNIGILENKPKSGEAAEVTVQGRAKAQAGAAIASGGLELAADATGRLQAAVSTGFVTAISLQAAGAAGDIIEVLKISGYFKP
jgi:hypothetical protein